MLKLTKKVLWVWSTFFLALWLSWQLLAQVDFGYGFWHDHGGIAESIDRYAPKNKYRKHFETTDRTQRLHAFHQIVLAIQNHGEGLKDIRYHTPFGTYPLLHNAEVVHLQDVANLIDHLNQAAFYILLLWLALTFLNQRQKTSPSLKQSGAILLIGLGLVGILLLLFGATEVFYQLHVWIFPDNHQWFFYYEDSLMSTMMKAPILFGYIAVLLALLATIIFLISTRFISKL